LVEEPAQRAVAWLRICDTLNIAGARRAQRPFHSRGRVPPIESEACFFVSIVRGPIVGDVASAELLYDHVTRPTSGFFQSTSAASNAAPADLLRRAMSWSRSFFRHTSLRPPMHMGRE